ncbi:MULTISPECIES: COG1470 family protein [Olivibacter]|uniref:Alpha-galactosidase NEW3 domain-containing protein n=2 Tax=Sphingobacteriaceae TaxID=84566 RepID=F4C1J1_SPHS2|nr:NEW3 domain-containing protein [Olivibacter sp. UJ_SKK_5.1]MDX3916698.1 NEW3 domain-containing protein [Pseudosphingobacterium sp.]
MLARAKRLYSFFTILFFLLGLLPYSFYENCLAQGLSLYTPYPKISVPPGESIDYSIDLINNSNAIKTSDISVVGLPKDWSYELKSGNWDVAQLSVLPKEKKSFNLKVNVPVKVNKGAFQFRVQAKGYASLPLTVLVSEQGGYKTGFSSDQRNMEGAANSMFTFNATLRNQTADNQVYALTAQALPGWNVSFKANGKQVSSVDMVANQTQNITVEIDPPDETKAGSYRVPVLATTANTSANLEFEVVIKGSYKMELTTPTGLLSTDVTAGESKRVQLALKNSGSADLKNVEMKFSAPANWDVVFEPAKIPLLRPGATVDVFATIKADKKAIAGDYVTELEAKTPEISSKASFRISVETSLLWGWLGIMIILAAIACVYYLIRKYGRR